MEYSFTPSKSRVPPSRRRVPDEKRQRTARACDKCKARKQKCDGRDPCSNCARKTIFCSYDTATRLPLDSFSPLPSKRQAVCESEADVSTKQRVNEETSDTKEICSPNMTIKKIRESKPPPIPEYYRNSAARKYHGMKPAPAGAAWPGICLPKNDAPKEYDEEEADFQATPRLLHDKSGRVFYTGESATLSYLQLLRLIVNKTRGNCDFTKDPSQEFIVDNVVSLPPQARVPCMLPSREQADVLVRSYFSNTSGLVDAFHRESFNAAYEACYLNPLFIDNAFLCSLYLVFAIGTVLAVPTPRTSEADILRSVDMPYWNQAELFYQSSRSHSSFLENDSLQSVQVLLLMAVYSLAISRRSEAFKFHGMAVRCAVAIGLNRKESTRLYPPECQALSRNLWKSLYVFDRFISASLGRPTCIDEEECTDAMLNDSFPTQVSTLDPPSSRPTATPALPYTDFEMHRQSMNASVRCCRIIGNILKKVYARRRVSIPMTKNIMPQCTQWTKDLDKHLWWSRVSGIANESSTGTAYTAPGQGTAILHANLLYCHTIILLTRPYFQLLMQSVWQQSTTFSSCLCSHMEKMSAACVAASYHTIALVQMAHERQYLSRRNPFVMYFLFSAALIVLSNEHAGLYHNSNYETAIGQAMAVMKYSSLVDPQAERVLWILHAFKDVIDNVADNESARKHQKLGRRRFRFLYPMEFNSGTIDPIDNFFTLDPIPNPGFVGEKRCLADSSLVNSISHSGKRATNAREIADMKETTEKTVLEQRASIIPTIVPSLPFLSGPPKRESMPPLGTKFPSENPREQPKRLKAPYMPPPLPSPPPVTPMSGQSLILVNPPLPPSLPLPPIQQIGPLLPSRNPFECDDRTSWQPNDPSDPMLVGTDKFHFDVFWDWLDEVSRQDVYHNGGSANNATALSLLTSATTLTPSTETSDEVMGPFVQRVLSSSESFSGENPHSVYPDPAATSDASNIIAM